jgi:hypothetical protein
MRSLALILSIVVALAACADQGDSDPDDALALGPVDGRDLPGTDLERIQVGDLAPDFSLVSLGGPVVTLSDFRGEKNVVLVFYRGYW